MPRHSAPTSGILVVACAGALAGGLAAVPIAGARIHAAGVASAPETRTLLARQTSTQDSKTGFSWKEQLSESGAKVGDDTGSCTFVGKGYKRATCKATLRLTDGTIVLRGTVNLADQFRLAIAGGTGAYAKAKGTADAKSAGKSKTLITLRFA